MLIIRHCGQNALLPLVITSLLTSPIAVSADWKPELLPAPPNPVGQPNRVISIRLPATLAASQLSALRIEVDNVDVTETVKRDGRILRITPVQDMSSGKHEVRLLEPDKDGNAIERGKWKVDVKKSTSRYTEFEHSISTDMSVTQRLYDNRLNSPAPRETAGQATIKYDGKWATKKWKFTGKFDATYNSQAGSQTPGANEFDLNDFLFTGDADRFSGKVGHHALETNNLVISDFNRRGISGTYQGENNWYKLTGFSMRTESEIGFKHGLGVSDSDHNTFGAVGVITPFIDTPERLNIMLSYVNGKGNTGGEGITGGTNPTIISGGQVYGLGVDTTTANKRWRLRGEYAASDFDIDGIDFGNNSVKDHAYSVTGIYSPKERTIEKYPLTWNATVDHRKIGTFYRSMANTTLPTDKLTTRAVFTLNYKEWALNTSFASESDNVEDIAALPRARSDAFSIGLTYTPTKEESPSIDSIKPTTVVPPANFNFFAKPTFSINYARAALALTKLPIPFTGAQTDTLNDIVGVNATFNPGKWSWTVGHTFTKTVDDTIINPATPQPLNNSLTNSTNIGLTIPFNEKFSFNPNYQFNNVDNSSTAVVATTNSLSFATNVVFLQDKLNGSFSYGLNKTNTTDGLNETNVHTYDATFTYILRQAKDNKPGVEWFLKGSVQNPDTGDNIVQVFTGVHIGWPVLIK